MLFSNPKAPSKSNGNCKNKMNKSISDKKIDFSDIPETTGLFWAAAKVREPVGKTAISIRIDDDVLEFFRKQGKGYQSKINAVLRSYKKHA